MNRRVMQQANDSAQPGGGGLAPSKPGYNFSTADLARQDIPPAVIGQILAASNANGGTPDVDALLAAILKNQFKKNSRYTVYPFQYAAFTIQQILTENPVRNTLLLQNTSANILYMIFEGNNLTPQDMSSASNQAILRGYVSRAVQIAPGGNFGPFVPPTNPVSLFALGSPVQGVIIEGQ